MAVIRSPLVGHLSRKLRACRARIGISREELGFRTSLHRAEIRHGSAEERDLWVEHALLSEIIILHPDHLTSEELVVRMEDSPSKTGSVAILDSLQTLKRSSLVRFNGEIVEPTYAALRAAAIFHL